MQFSTALITFVAALAAAAPTPNVETVETPELTVHEGVDIKLEERQARGDVILNLDGTQLRVPLGIQTVVNQVSRQVISFVSAPTGVRVSCQVDLEGRPSALVGNFANAKPRVELNGGTTSTIRCSSLA
jgi:hypothetical protein